MTRLSEIEQHIASMDELQGVIGALRSLAGTRVQDAQHALPGARRYAEVVADAVGSALLLREPLRPARRGRQARTTILFATEHGFVGGYNARLFDELEAMMRPGDSVMIVGSRGAIVAAERKLEPVWIHPMASRCEGAAETTRRLTAELFRRILDHPAAEVDLVYGRSRRGGAPEVTRKTLLPLDPSTFPPKPGALPPLVNLPPAALIEKLTSEYIFALLTEAAIESIAGENNARFATMDSAHGNITRKLTELNDRSREVRQSEITMELLDIVTGAEALLHRS